MKESIDWHLEGLRNSNRYHISQLDEVINRLKSTLRSITRDEFTEYQIEEAIRQGKDSFDGDKFKKKDKLSQEEIDICISSIIENIQEIRNKRVESLNKLMDSLYSEKILVSMV